MEWAIDRWPLRAKGLIVNYLLIYTTFTTESVLKLLTLCSVHS